MITKTKQNWSIGSKVKVGFLTLTVIGCTKSTNCGPDVYQMMSDKGHSYEFQPHQGLVRL